MNPIQTKRYASSIGFSPATAPNTAAQQKRQDDEFIKQLEETRNIEIQQEAEMLARLKNNNQIERANLRDVGAQQEEYDRQQDQIKSNQIEREYRAQQAVTGGVNAGDKKFNDALNLVTKLSSTAASFATKIGSKIQAESEAAAEAAYNKQKAEGYSGFATPQAQEQRATDLGAATVEAKFESEQWKQASVTAQIDRQGTPEARALAFNLRGKNGWWQNAYKKAMAADLGKNYATTELARIQQLKLDEPDAQIVIDGKSVAVSTLDLGDAQTAGRVIGAGIPSFLKKNGLDGDSNLIVGGFYNEVAASQQQIQGTLRNAEIEVQKQDIVDQAEGIFKLDATPLNAKMLYTTYTQQGVSAKQARSKMISQMAALPQDQFDAVLDSPFGPNGLSFREQYPLDTQTAISQRNTFIQGNQQAQKFVQESQNEQFAIEFNAARMADLEGDGTFDADPATLADLAQQRELVGDTKGAALVRSAIPMTQSKQYDKSFLETLQSDMDIGISNFSVQQIQNNQSLSPEAKRAALKLVKEAEANAVPSNIKTRDENIMKAALKNRIGDNPMQKGPAHFTLKIAEGNAWKEYQAVYRQELNRTGDSESAAKAALDDFYAKFNDKEGQYQIGDVLKKESAIFTKFNTTGKVYDPSVQLLEVDEKVHTRGAEAFNEAELYKGETKDLQSMVETSTKNGKLHVPDTLRRTHQRMGGNISLRQLLNQRLEANGLDPLSSDVGKTAEQIEMSFDPIYNKLLNFKPNPTRTDIATIGSGGDPIYVASNPSQENIKNIFGKRESPQEQYDAINAGSGGDRPGGATKHLGRSLTSMTLGEVKAHQNLPKGDPKGIFAVGKYQFIPATLNEAAAAAGITDDMPFNEAVQDRIFFVHLDRYGAQGPWEQWWIQQGGDHLRLTPQEQKSIDAFREAYDPSKPWRQSRNMRPELIGVQ